MGLIKHSKYKNTGIIFELLVRQITADTLAGKDSKAINILKKYFVKTELGKEYKLYETLSNKTNLSETKAEIIISSLIESSKHLNKEILKKQKYNVIKEINKEFGLDNFFKTKLPNYKPYAALYTLIEINNNNSSNPEQIISNKISLLEHLTLNIIDKEQIKENVMEEYKGYDKGLRALTYKVLLDKFNNKYDNLNTDQKLVLKEFINNADNYTKLKEFYNLKTKEIKITLTEINKNTQDSITKIKTNEVIKMLNEIKKSDKIKNNDMINLLHYYELIEELRLING
jgi:hypothetical protein